MCLVLLLFTFYIPLVLNFIGLVVWVGICLSVFFSMYCFSISLCFREGLSMMLPLPQPHASIACYLVLVNWRLLMCGVGREGPEEISMVLLQLQT